MGGDGGSIPKRADMIKTKGYSQKRNLGGMGYSPNTMVFTGTMCLSSTRVKDLLLSTCALTQEPLQKPVVIDKKGYLIGKEHLIKALIEFKANATPLPPHLSHIKSLKKDCRTIGDDKWKTSTDVGMKTGGITGNILWCPLKNIYITGSTASVFFWGCGCVASLTGWAAVTGKELSELQYKRNDSDGMCPICGADYKKGEVIEIGYVQPEADAPDLFGLPLKSVPPVAGSLTNRETLTSRAEGDGSKRLRMTDIELNGERRITTGGPYQAVI